MSTSGRKQNSSSSGKNQTRADHGLSIKHSALNKSAVHKPVPGRGSSGGSKGNGGTNN